MSNRLDNNLPSVPFLQKSLPSPFLSVVAWDGKQDLDFETVSSSLQRILSGWRTCSDSVLLLSFSQIRLTIALVSSLVYRKKLFTIIDYFL